jgi:hypothetical protein
MSVFSYVQGRTVPIDRTLKKGPRGAAAAFDASGMTVTLELRDRNGDVVTEAGTTDWADAAVSRVRFNPHADDLVAGKLFVRWRVVDALGKVAFFPGGEAEEWIIRL